MSDDEAEEIDLELAIKKAEFEKLKAEARHFGRSPWKAPSAWGALLAVLLGGVGTWTTWTTKDLELREQRLELHKETEQVAAKLQEAKKELARQEKLAKQSKQELERQQTLAKQAETDREAAETAMKKAQRDLAKAQRERADLVRGIRKFSKEERVRASRDDRTVFRKIAEYPGTVDELIEAMDAGVWPPNAAGLKPPER